MTTCYGKILCRFLDMSAALAIINAEHDAVRTVGDRRIHVKAGQQIRAADGVVLARKPTKPQN